MEPLAKRLIRIAGCLLLSMLFLGACTGAQKVEDPVTSLERIAENYWTKRLVDRDYEFTYDLELEKDTLSYPEYLKRVEASQTFKVLSVKTKTVKIEGDQGEVYLTVEGSAPFLPKAYPMMLQDLWVRQSNQWKHKFTDR